MADLEALIAQWMALPPQQAQGFYEEQVFPAVLREVVPRERQRWGLTEGTPGYETMVLTLGTSPEPLIISLSVWRPERVLLLATAESRSLVDRVCAQTGLSWGQVDLREVDRTDPGPLYREIKDAYHRWGRPQRGAADITGGTKVMVAGAAMAASTLGFDVVYVGWGRYLSEQRRPYPGTEQVFRVSNPLVELGDLDFQTARAMADRRDYGGASGVLERLAGKAPGEASLVYRLWGALCRTYEAWDLLDLEAARRFAEEVRRLLDQHGRLAQLEPLRGQEAFLAAQAEALDLLAQRLPRKAAALPVQDLTDPQLMSAVLSTIYHAALRREGSGRRDMAALLWYRLLEMLEQSRLAQLGLDTAVPDWEAFGQRVGRSEEELLAGLNEVRGRFKHRLLEELPSPVALVDGYELLAAVEEEPLCVELGRLVHQVQRRNLSIYAHGYAFVSEQDLQDFRKLGEEILERFFRTTGWDRAAWDGLAFLTWEEG